MASLIMHVIFILTLVVSLILIVVQIGLICMELDVLAGWAWQLGT